MIEPVEIFPGIYRGSRPVSYWDWQMLKKLGIKYALDLQTTGQFDEQMHAESVGITTFCLPLSWLFAPRLADLYRANNFAWAHRPVYIHCRAGKDRTGMVAAFIKIINGMPKAAAITEMKKMGMHWWYAWWAYFL